MNSSEIIDYPTFTPVFWWANFPKFTKVCATFPAAFGGLVFLISLFLNRRVFSACWSGGTCLHSSCFQKWRSAIFRRINTQGFQRNAFVGRFDLQMTFEDRLQMSFKAFFCVLRRHVWGGFWHAFKDGHVAGRNHGEDEGEGKTSDVERPADFLQIG